MLATKPNMQQYIDQLPEVILAAHRPVVVPPPQDETFFMEKHLKKQSDNRIKSAVNASKPISF
ncbi:MAG: hypothetical protein WDO71_25570 [Bacteroidota bacterium]